MYQVFVGYDFGQCMDFVGFEVEVQGFVWVVLVIGYVQVFEVYVLDVDLFFGEFVVFLVEFDGVEFGVDFVLFFFDCDFDWQVMVVLVWYIGCIEVGQVV